MIIIDSGKYFRKSRILKNLRKKYNVHSPHRNWIMVPSGTVFIRIRFLSYTLSYTLSYIFFNSESYCNDSPHILKVHHR